MQTRRPGTVGGTQILYKLQGGDLRSIGRSSEVVRDVLKDPKLFERLFEGMIDNDPVVRARAADAVEKVSRQRPDYLQPFKLELVTRIADVNQQEVRWHVAQMFSHIRPTKREKERIVYLLYSWLATEESAIVKVSCIQTLSEFEKTDRSMRPRLTNELRRLIRHGTPATKARARKLIKDLS